MKFFNLLFVLVLSVLLPLTQMSSTYASTSLNINVALSSIRSSIESEHLIHSFSKTTQNFFHDLSRLNETEKMNAFRELKKKIPYTSQLKMDQLMDEVQSGVLTNAEIDLRIAAISKSSQSTGAAWESSPELVSGLVFIIGLAIIFLIVGTQTGSNADLVDPNYCDVMLMCPPPVCFIIPETGETNCSSDRIY